MSLGFRRPSRVVVTRAEQIERDLSIALDVATSSLTQADIAARYGVGERTVRRALKRVAQRGVPGGPPRLEMTRTTLVRLQAAIEEIALLCDQAADPETRLAAIRLQAGLMAQQVDLELACLRYRFPDLSNSGHF